MLDTPGLILDATTNAQEPSEGYLFYAFDCDDIKSIMATIYSDFEKHKKDWLVIKADSAFIDKNREHIQELAKKNNFKVILIY